jgi:hypothetical protein
MRWNLTERLKNREKQICAIALVASMLCILGYPLYLYVEVDSPDSNRASVSYLIEFSEICRPSGDDLAQWAPAPSGGGNYVNVDETTVGSDTTTTYNEADATNEKDIYTMSDMAELDRGEYTEIDGVTLWLWAIRGSAGINQLQAGVRISDTDYVGITSATTSSWVNYTYTYTLNPATSAAWTITEINALECYILGVDSAPSHHVSQLAVLVPGRQTCWPPTFTSTPDEDAIVGNAYSYTATANETSTFSLYDSDAPVYSSGTLYTVADAHVYSETPTTNYGSSATLIAGGNTGIYYYTYLRFEDFDTPIPAGYEVTAAWLNYYVTTDTSDNVVAKACADNDWLENTINYENDPGVGATSGSTAAMNPTGTGWANATITSPVDTSATENGGEYVHLLVYVASPVAENLQIASKESANDPYLVVHYTPSDWLTFTPANATLWGTPGVAGEWTVSILAVSASGEGSAWQNFTVHVTEPWVPSFTSEAVETAVYDFEYNYSYTTNESCTFEVTFPGSGGDGWLNDTWAYYKYLDSSASEAYVSGNDVWNYDRIIFFRLDLSSLPDSATLSTVGIDIYKNYETANGVVDVNRSEAWGGVNGSYSGVWNEAYLKSLTPAGSLAWTGEDDGATGWWNWSDKDMTPWQTQFDTNKTLYFALTGWAYSTSGTSYGFSASTARFDIEYSGAAGTWLSWDSEDDFIWGTPTGDDGPVDVSIKATNSVGGVTYQNFTVTVGDGWAPTFTSSPDETGSAENLYSYTPTCNETVTWPVDDSFATNATFLHWGQANNTIYGTPAIEDVGSYYVNISAVSVAGYLTAYHNYTLVISIPDVTDPVAIAAWAQLPTGSLNFTYGYTGFDTVLDGGYSYDDVGIDNYTWALDIDGVPSSNRYGSSFWEIFTVPGLYEWTLTVSDGTNDDYTEFSFTLNQSMVLWPTGDMGGTGGSWSPVGDPNETECIKDPALQVISSPYYDGDDTYIYSTLGVDPYYITFSLDDFYIELSEGQSFNVTVFAWVKELDEGDSIYLGIQDEDTLTETYDIYETTTSWVNYSQTWEENPVTDAPWTTNDINETNLFIWNDLNDNDAVTLAGLFIQISYVDTTDPVANAGPDQSVDTGDTVTFSGAASTDNFGIVNYTWTFTYNSTTVTLYLVGPSYTFEIVGSYVVTLNVSDAAGYWDTDTMTVTVEEIPPNPIEWLTTSGVMLMLGLIGFVGMIAFPVLYIKFRDKGQGNMNGFVAFIIYEMILFGMFFAALLGAG